MDFTNGPTVRAYHYSYITLAVWTYNWTDNCLCHTLPDFIILSTIWLAHTEIHVFTVNISQSTFAPAKSMFSTWLRMKKIADKKGFVS